MRVVESLAELRQARRTLPPSTGFVPTMGALHQGHGQLLRTARELNRSVVVSIFVNPTQFGPGEDFERYPRTRASDLDLCREAGADLVWFPRVEDLYPQGHQTTVEVEPLGRLFEGESRPGHFRGVATVVTKLLLAVAPGQAFFGRKDLQQYCLVRRLVSDLLLEVEVVGVDTVREANGLALSSRNNYLSPEHREQAGFLYRALRSVQERYRQGERRVAALRSLFLDGVPIPDQQVERCDFLAGDLSRAFADGDDFPGGYLSVAVPFHGVRLIDNVEL